MNRTSVDHLDLLRAARRSASDQRKVFLTVYGLLLFLPLLLFVIALGRTALWGQFGLQVQETLLRPAVASLQFFQGAFADGAWTLMGGVLLGAWVGAKLIGSFFGLAVTRMAAIELTCDRRGEAGESLAFARRHWIWAFLTPVGLAFAALLLVAVAAALFSLGRISDWFIVLAAPCALVLAIGAVIIVFGLVAGGGLAWPTIATEWSDAFDAITRVYGYSFAHAYRVLLYRLGAGLVLLTAVVVRACKASMVMLAVYLALLVGLGRGKTDSLIDAALLERPGGLPWPQTVAGWTLVACLAIYLTMVLARLIVFRLCLRQAIYLVLRLRVDKVPLDDIDGYRPDDSAYDPTAQGFELVEVEEEIPPE